MANDVKRRQVDCGASAVDRISNLPKNVIDLILEWLPLHDAARTTVLSKAWRSVWETHPHLVLDDAFFSQLLSKKVGRSRQSEVSTTISNILLLHTGPVMKFHLSIPRDMPLPYTDLWIKKVSRSGIRKLELSNKPILAYKMPSYLFSCLELTHLSLDYCILNPPPRFGGFPNLIDVKLVNVIISADMSFGSQLQKLYMQESTGIEHLGCQFKYSNNLRRLMIIDSEEIDWKWFECTKMLKGLGLILSKESSISRKEVVSLDKILGNMPEIRALRISGFSLKCSELGASALKRLKTMEKMRCLSLSCAVFCDSVQIQCVLCLIKSSPNLKLLYINVEEPVMSRDDTGSLEAGRVEQYLRSPNFVDMILDQLETVEIGHINGSRSELNFIKLLLASSPSLRWMKLSKSFTIDDPKEELRILGEVTRLPRASPTARIVWT